MSEEMKGQWEMPVEECEKPIKNSLLEYIETAIELETDLITQEQIAEQCQAEILGRKPTLELKDIPDRPQAPSSNKGCLYTLIIYGTMVFITLVHGDLEDGELLAMLFFGGIVLWGIKALLSEKEEKNKYDKQFRAYERQMEEVTKQNKEKEHEYNCLVSECEASCKAIAEEAQPHIDETRSILSRLYSKGIIYPKYCNLPALTSIYEYFITGRCEELVGPHGAYNIYEDEMRKDTVISQLNTVIENLEQIRQNQYKLYEQVCAIQQNTEAIRNELAEIKGYTIEIAQLEKLQAYYARRTARNTRILNYFHL